ncbi:MAG TPA: glycoside hydrolase family 3 C-terminal domain-containing protein, partial [Naasia sp.]
LEAIASHVLTALDLSGVEAPANPRLPLDDAASQALAQEELEAGAVLLRNDELLPLDAGAVGTVALVGVDDPTALLVMGGSAAVGLSSARIASVADQLETRTGARPVVAPGTRGDVPLPPLRSVVSAVVRDDGAGTEQTVALDEFALLDPPAEVGADWSAVLETAYEPTDSGPHVLTLTFAGEARLLVGGEELATGFREASPMVEGPEYPLHAVAHLTEGRSVRVRVEYRTGPAITIPGTPVRPGLRLGVEPVAERISAAVDAAAAADVAVLIVGRVTGEAMDADSIRLPGDQELLVRAVTAANPRTVLVTLSGGPVALPDGVQPAAVLHVWNPGEGFAPALVRLLFGDAEPGGRLPLTFPGDEAQTPVAASGRYPGADGVVDYDEGLLVGYRWYDAEEIEPAYPFGHGLGYTEIALDRFTAERIGDRITARLTVRNSGARTGKAVPQIYSSSPAPAGHPPQTLRAFAAVRLEPGESRRLSLDIPVRDLVAYDTEGTPSVHAGTYTFTAGWSSRDLVAASDVVVESS